jgi:hypothetical protein
MTDRIPSKAEQALRAALTDFKWKDRKIELAGVLACSLARIGEREEGEKAFAEFLSVSRSAGLTAPTAFIAHVKQLYRECESGVLKSNETEWNQTCRVARSTLIRHQRRSKKRRLAISIRCLDSRRTAHRSAGQRSRTETRLPEIREGCRRGDN